MADAASKGWRPTRSFDMTVQRVGGENEGEVVQSDVVTENATRDRRAGFAQAPRPSTRGIERGACSNRVPNIRSNMSLCNGPYPGVFPARSDVCVALVTP